MNGEYLLWSMYFGVPACVAVMFLSCCVSLRQGFQNGVHLLSNCCQCKLKLVLIRRRKGEENLWVMMNFIQKKKVRKVKLKYFTHNQIKGAGTLVRTSPGLWSLMCSSVAAMSISFTPNEDKQEKKILWWYWVYNSLWCQLMLIKLWHVLTVSHVKDWIFENVFKIFQIVCACVWLTLSHAIQYHVDEDVRASSTSPIAAENPQNIYIFLVKFT